MVGRARFERATNWLKANGYPAKTTDHTWHSVISRPSK